MHEEAAPANEVFLVSLNLPKSIGSHADRDLHRDVEYFARPTSLENESIQVHVGKLSRDLAVAPGLDVPVWICSVA
jgi:hypothetical protein